MATEGGGGARGARGHVSHYQSQVTSQSVGQSVGGVQEELKHENICVVSVCLLVSPPSLSVYQCEPRSGGG